MLKSALQILLAFTFALPQAFADQGSPRDLRVMTLDFVRTGDQGSELIEAVLNAPGPREKNVELMIWTILEADVSNAQKAVRLRDLESALSAYAIASRQNQSSSVIAAGTFIGLIVMMFVPIFLQDPNAHYRGDHITAAFEGVGRGIQYIFGVGMGAAVGALLGNAADAYLKSRANKPSMSFGAVKQRLAEECAKLLEK